MIRANEIVSRRNEKKTAEGRKVMLVPLKSEKRPKGEPVYRDPDNPFNTWTGIGKRPAWLTAKLDAGISLEAMKMHNKIQAPISGTVIKIHVNKGDKLPKDALMFEIK